MISASITDIGYKNGDKYDLFCHKPWHNRPSYLLWELNRDSFYVVFQISCVS